MEVVKVVYWAQSEAGGWAIQCGICALKVDVKCVYGAFVAFDVHCNSDRIPGRKAWRFCIPISPLTCLREKMNDKPIKGPEFCITSSCLHCLSMYGV